MIKYLVDGFGSWFVVKCKNKREAYSEGVKEYGRGNVKEVRIATKNDIDYFVSQKGKDALSV